MMKKRKIGGEKEGKGPGPAYSTPHGAPPLRRLHLDQSALATRREVPHNVGHGRHQPCPARLRGTRPVGEAPAPPRGGGAGKEKDEAPAPPRGRALGRPKRNSTFAGPGGIRGVPNYFYLFLGAMLFQRI